MLTNLKRYNLAADTLAGVVEHAEGSFVHWNDYARLMHDIEAGAAEITRLIEWQRKACDVLPLIQRDQGSDLAHRVSELLSTERAKWVEYRGSSMATLKPVEPTSNLVCADCNGTGWFNEGEKVACEECVTGEQRYFEVNGHYPGCGVYEGTQRGPCSCNAQNRTPST